MSTQPADVNDIILGIALSLNPHPETPMAENDARYVAVGIKMMLVFMLDSPDNSAFLATRFQCSIADEIRGSYIQARKAHASLMNTMIGFLRDNES
jgi:hypothetical protein